MFMFHLSSFIQSSSRQVISCVFWCLLFTQIWELAQPSSLTSLSLPWVGLWVICSNPWENSHPPKEFCHCSWAPGPSLVTLGFLPIFSSASSFHLCPQYKLDPSSLELWSQASPASSSFLLPDQLWWFFFQVHGHRPWLVLEESFHKVQTKSIFVSWWHMLSTFLCLVERDVVIFLILGFSSLSFKRHIF